MATLPLQAQPAHYAPMTELRSGLEIASEKPCFSETQAQAETVFDRLYDQYLPFRLYADYMSGSSPRDLALHFGLAEHWVAERIEAVRLCIHKQVRLNLLHLTQ